MVPWPDVLVEWLKSETCWTPGLNIQQCTSVAFTIEDDHRARLIAMGLPNAPEEIQRAPFPTDTLVLLNRREWVLEKEVVYMARGFTYDGNTLDLQQSSPTTLVAPVLNDPATDAGWAELFAGLGSWSWAAKTLGIQMWASVEANPYVAEAFNVNHELQCHAIEVSNWTWVKGRAFAGLASSPPCPAFSTLRGSPGFQSKAADPWKQLFSACRSLQTPCVLIENVSGILAHLDIVKDVMRVCGYRLVSSRVCDLADMAPAKRSRWFGMFMRQHMKLTCPLADFYPKFGPKFIGLCRAVQPKEWPTEDLQIPEDIKDILSNPVYVKGAKTPEQTWQRRLVKEYHTAPTFTHQYGNAWNLPPPTLLKGGLHCPIFSPCGPDSTPRMFSPWEIARMHLLPSSLVLPQDVLSAWQLLGNGVSPAQCILGFGMCMSALGKATAEDLLKAIQTTMQDTVSFEGREPVCRAGWQSLELKTQAPVVPTILEAPSDVASDDSGRCFCNDPLDTATEVGTPRSDEDSPMPRAEFTWDPLEPPVSEQEWELHGQMFKRIDALQNPGANTFHHVQDLVSSDSNPLDAPQISSNTFDRQKDSLGAHALPDTLPWPPIVHRSIGNDSISPHDYTSAPDCTQVYPDLLEHSKQCLQTWEPSPHFTNPLDDDPSPSAFDGSDHQGSAVPISQEQSFEDSTKMSSLRCRVNLGVFDTCGGPVSRNPPLGAMSQKESSSQATADDQSGMDTDVTGTLAAPATPPEAFQDRSRSPLPRRRSTGGKQEQGPTPSSPPGFDDDIDSDVIRIKV